MYKYNQSNNFSSPEVADCDQLNKKINLFYFSLFEDIGIRIFRTK